MTRIERAGNHFKEPKPKDAGIWTRNGVEKWKDRSGKEKIPKEIRKKISLLLWGAPVNIRNERSDFSFRTEDILEVKFPVRGKHETEILNQNVIYISDGKRKECRAPITKQQIDKLIEKRRQVPITLYWEHHMTDADVIGGKRKIIRDEHIEVTFPYSEIASVFKLPKGVKPVENEGKDFSAGQEGFRRLKGRGPHARVFVGTQRNDIWNR